MLKVVELFAGIGSQTQALKNIGIPHKVVAISEFDKFADLSYRALHGQVNNMGDITKIAKLPQADLWTYSFPCQDISNAGKQKGFAKGSGTRSGLLWEVERLLRVSQESGELPDYLLMENVRNLVSEKFIDDFYEWGRFLNSLGYINYADILNAKDYTIPQNRERVFMVSIRNGKKYQFPKPVPLELRLKDVLENAVDKKYYLNKTITEFYIENTEKQAKNGNGFKFEPTDGNCVGKAITTRAGSRMDDNFILENEDVICLNQYDENGKQRKQHERVYDTSGEMTALCPGVGGRHNIVEPKCEVVGSLGGVAREDAARVYSVNGLSPCLNTMQGGHQEPKILAIDEQNGTVNDKYFGALTTDGSSPKHNNRVFENYRIRKLTPKECWRLMGFVDEQTDKVRPIMSDAQMYKQAGNSIVVQVLEAIFTNLFLKDFDTNDYGRFEQLNQIKLF